MHFSRQNIETLLIGVAACAILFYTTVDYFRGQDVDRFIQAGARHTSAEAQCDCESENEIRSHIGMQQRRCDYGVCSPREKKTISQKASR